MDEINQLKEPTSFLPDLVRTAALSIVLLAIPAGYYRVQYGWRDTLVLPGLVFLMVAGLYWQIAVHVWVPNPYLDEIFHIPQAQKYCQGRWLEWDDKITTPPGLYAISVGIVRFNWLIPGVCSAFTLRMTNWVALILLAWAALQCRRLIEAAYTFRRGQEHNGNLARKHRLSIYALHSGINIALFPLLFFFSGLYYTDVFSSLVVLLAFWNHLNRMSNESKTVSQRSNLLVILLGVASLFMRQTNVFWVVVFMGGLEAVYAVKSTQPPRTEPGQFDRQTMFKYLLSRYSQGDVHDPPLDKAGLEDVFFCVLSLAIGALCNPLRLAKQIWPHFVVLGLFAGFVYWNGSVVLGDKANHVATIHLPQMLYIWPLFAFFSAPLLLSWGLQPILATLSTADPLTLIRRSVKKPSSNPFRTVLSLAGYASLAPVALMIVKYNTVIHPFTLADNRHYMFYIFRYSILRGEGVRFAMVPVYILCGIACWKTLAGTSIATQHLEEPVNGVIARNKSSSTVKAIQKGKESVQNTLHDELSSPASTSHHPPTISTALLWILATTLSLMTAPLVEPRYFILPWVFWRLFVPAWTPAHSLRLPASAQSLSRLAQRYDVRLWAETVWLLLVNVVTMYIFIAKPFYWRRPDGILIEEGLQRFMW